jgi:hypothetical protein
MDEANPYRPQAFSSFGTTLVFLGLALLLTACGGGATDGMADNGVNGTGNSATLAWDAPATGTNLAGYRIYFGTEPGRYLQPFGQGISVGNVTSYTLMGLGNGTQYYFAVTTFDIQGNESGYSNEAFKDMP